MTTAPTKAPPSQPSHVSGGAAGKAPPFVGEVFKPANCAASEATSPAGPCSCIPPLVTVPRPSPDTLPLPSQLFAPFDCTCPFLTNAEWLAQGGVGACEPPALDHFTLYKAKTSKGADKFVRFGSVLLSRDERRLSGCLRAVCLAAFLDALTSTTSALSLALPRRCGGVVSRLAQRLRGLRRAVEAHAEELKPDLPLQTFAPSSHRGFPVSPCANCCPRRSLMSRQAEEDLEFLHGQEQIRAVGPKALHLAVLKDAIYCLRGFEMRSTQSRQLAQRAKRWIDSDDSDAVFSFNNVCAALELAPSWVRSRLPRVVRVGKSHSHRVHRGTALRPAGQLARQARASARRAPLRVR